MSSTNTYRENRFHGDKGSLNYAESQNTGTPMLFLHGVTRCWQDMEPLMSAFAGEYQVFGLDFRGHGLSDRFDTYLTVDYIRDAVSFISTRFDVPCVIFGHSLGAMVAAGVAAEIPESVAALILEDPPFDTLGANIFKTSFHPYFTALNELVAKHSPSECEMAQRLAELRFPSPDGKIIVRLGDVRSEEAIRFHANCLLRLDPNALVPILAGHWLAGWNWEAELHRISCPTLLLAGDSACGGMLPAEVADRVTRLIPPAVRVDFKGAGHQLHATQLDRVVEIVQAFLKRR